MTTISLLRLLAVAVCALAATAASAHGFAVKEVSVDGSDSYPFAVIPMGPMDRARASTIDAQIVGGHDAQPQEFPHQASMQVVLPGFLWWDADPLHICGGTLIKRGWVLTAAHCVYGVPSITTRVEVVVGITDLYDEGTASQRFEVVEMLAHEEYYPSLNQGVGPNDIALLKLKAEAKISDSVALALLPTPGTVPEGDAVLSGWGSTSEDGLYPLYPEKLQTAVFPIVSYKTCYNFISKSFPGGYNPLAITNLCVGPIDRAHLSSCSGDSGGPLIQKNDKGQAVVIGVVSWGLANCGSVPFPSVFTRTSAFVDWINNQIKAYQ